MAFNSNYLNYLQRIVTNNSFILNRQFTSSQKELRGLFKINGYSRPEKQPQRDPAKQIIMPSEDILYGLFQAKINLAFIIQSASGSLDFCVGTWESDNTINQQVSNPGLNEKLEIISSLLDSTYPSIDIKEFSSDDIFLTQKNIYSQAAIVTGIPTIKPLNNLDGAFPIDKLVRGLLNFNWSCLILAQPIKEETTNELRLSALNAFRGVQDEMEANRKGNPLAQYYSNMLEILVDNYTVGLLGGNWRTGVYLLGDNKSFNRLIGVWKGIFSGERSLPEPINIQHYKEVLDLAANWQLPDVSETPGPGGFNYLFKYQTLLNSIQLSSYFHLPQIESSGFKINLLPAFDLIPPVVKSQKTLSLGNIISESQLSNITKTNKYKSAVAGAPYKIDIDNIKKHIFISGITGSGKTNTIFQLLLQTQKYDIPFLVIEPAKTEYRALITNNIFTKEIFNIYSG